MGSYHHDQCTKSQRDLSNHRRCLDWHGDDCLGRFQWQLPIEYRRQILCAISSYTYTYTYINANFDSYTYSKPNADANSNALRREMYTYAEATAESTA